MDSSPRPRPYGTKSFVHRRIAKPFGQASLRFRFRDSAGFHERRKRLLRQLHGRKRESPDRTGAGFWTTNSSNPLFLSSVCRSMGERAGIKVISARPATRPRKLFEFVPENEDQSRWGRRTTGTPALYTALLACAGTTIASTMVQARDDNIPLKQGGPPSSNTALESLPVSGHSWLTILEGFRHFCDAMSRGPVGPVTPLEPPERGNSLLVSNAFRITF